MVLQGICPELAGGRPKVYGKEQHPLLWARSWAAHGKITILVRGTTNLLNYCLICIIYCIHNFKIWPWTTWYNLAGHVRPSRRGLEAHGQSSTNFWMV